MTTDDSQFQKWVGDLLDGELEAADRDALARLCEARPDLARRLRDELELAEMIRQIARDEWGEAAFSEELGQRLRGGTIGVDQAPELIQRLLDGDLTDEQLRSLVTLCWRDGAIAAEVRAALIQDDLLHQVVAGARSEAAFVEALETRMWAEQAEDQFVSSVASKIVSMAPAGTGTVSIPLAPVAETPVRPRRERLPVTSIIALAGGWAAAAAAVVLLGMAIQFQPKPGAPMESVAEVTRVRDDVRWQVEGAPVEDRYFAPGRYALESGVITVTFGSGAEMTVEGPAEFEVRGEREAFVHSGVAVLAKNDAVANGGFTLGTDALDLGESGETIGLVANGAASAEAVVFDGESEICLPRLGFCRELFALEPVRADLRREKLFDIPYNPGVFAKAWQANAGIQGNTGPLRVALPGETPLTDPQPKAGEVRLSVEKIRFVAAGEIEVDTLEPGQFAQVSAGDGRKLDSSGRQLRSFLLEWDAATGTLTKDGEPVEASVTFDHEIVGVIYSPERLADSDDLVGAAGDGLLAARGQSAPGAGDQILLSDDRRTVNLKLSGDGGDRLDHVRVLVALN